jgi:tRNA pseudouridine38-40 synthase
MNHRYVILIAYDGSFFGGWQTQRRGNSIQESLEDSFYATFKKSVRLIAASRTDVGVHAFGQVVLCLTDLDLAADRLLKVWNDNLPKSIMIRDLKKIKNKFHPWYNVYEKRYYYHIFCSRPLPFLAPYGWHVKAPVDWDRVKVALELFVGNHDFKAFKHSDDGRINTQREIKRIDLLYNKRYKVWCIEVRGKSFLRHMIRKMVGAALFIGIDTEVPIESIKEALEVGNSLFQFPTAPAQGLLLRSIQYMEVISNE